MTLVIGLMSGTSLDGVDAALVDFTDPRPRTVATHWLAYPPPLRKLALRLQAPSRDEIHAQAVFANELAHCCDEAVRRVLSKGGVAAGQVRAIGCHGQTLRHRPAAGYSIQANNPALLAELTGIAVVADFRSRDIAAGGQGAPLVPGFHAAVFGDPQRHRAILNIGGIANLTNLKPKEPVTGFDTGPGNLLIDAWIERHKGVRYDTDGAWAASGTILPDLLGRLLGDGYFDRAPPRSCGREEFNLLWLGARLGGGERPQDVQATLADFTAVSASQAIGRWCGTPEEVFVCGGGARNAFLMDRLQHHLPGRRVTSTDSLGQPADWVEAVAFAWLAWRTLEGLPGNLPSVTGADGPRVLGAISPR